MPVPGQLAKFLLQRVTIAPRLAVDGYTNPVPGAGVQYAARVVRKTQLVRTMTGEEQVSSVTVYLADDFSIAPDALITLPDGSQPPILSILAYPGRTGNGYQKVLC